MKAGALIELLQDEVLETDVVRVRAWMNGDWVYFKIPKNVDFQHDEKQEVATLEVVELKNVETKNLDLFRSAPAAVDGP